MAITYDAIGNPSRWRNARIMLWNGRELATFSRDMLNNTLTFKYNADGVRIQKRNTDYINYTYFEETHDYIVDGTDIVKETVNTINGYGTGATTETNVLYYYYDETGVCGFELNGTSYYYLKNNQGDVVKILNASGTVVTEYTYDAWGKVLSTTGSLAGSVGAINPFRYRGYYYDTETGYYYLQSRYYYPQVGRFINADSYVSTGQGILGNNMFVYCGNNPVGFQDENGDQYVDALTGSQGTGIVRIIAVGGAIIVGKPLIDTIRDFFAKLFFSKAHAIDDADALAKDIVVPDEPKQPAVFPVSPYDFHPRGLTIKVYFGTYNGMIITWSDPIIGMPIFEWDEDLEHGPHYHTFVTGTKKHTDSHYKAGDLVPSPFNVIYF